MDKIIQAGDSLTTLDARIVDALKGKTFWGDLEISKDEYELLRDIIKEEIDNEDGHLLRVARKHKVSVTTAMVFMVRYKYNYNFWGLLSEELDTNININHENELGQCAKMSFKANNFDFCDVADERRKNIEPILYEAGLPPESSLDDLFYVLNYDSHSEFDPQLIIEDLIEMRSYQIRKPMLKFLKRFKEDRALEFVLEVRDAMLSVDQNRSGTARYIDNYADWKEREHGKEATTARKKQDFQTRPYLMFDHSKQGLCLVLPRVNLQNEWIEDVSWEVDDYNGGVSTKDMRVLGDDGRRYIEPIVLPVSPSDRYLVTLRDCEAFEDDEICKWDLDGIRNNGIIFFNSNGRMINANYIPYPYGVAIVGAAAEIVGYQSVNVNLCAYPTDREGYRVFSIEPENSGASFTYVVAGQTYELHAKPQIKAEFAGNTLFSMPTYACNNLFTEVPELIVEVEEGVDTEKLEIRVNNKSYIISDDFNNNIAKISLHTLFASMFQKYGTYSVRIYQNNLFLKQVEFSYLPDIKSSYKSGLSWPIDGEVKQTRSYLFEKSPDYTLEFEDCTVGSTENDYIVEPHTKAGAIRVLITSMMDEVYFKCSAVLPIKPFEMDIIDASCESLEQGVAGGYRVSLEEFREQGYWLAFSCFGAFAGDTYLARVTTVNGIEQEEYIPRMRTGGVNFNLAIFTDTLNNCLLPAKLEIVNTNYPEFPVAFLTISDCVQLRRRVLFAPNGYIVLDGADDNNNSITISRFGATLYTHTLPFSNAKKDKKGRVGYKCGSDIPAGLYVVESHSNDSFFEEEDLGVIPSNGPETFVITYRAKESEIATVSDWIDELLKIVLNVGRHKDFGDSPNYGSLVKLEKIKDTTVTQGDLEKMIALAYLVNDKCHNGKKTRMLKIMRKMSLVLLDSHSRLEMIRVMAKINCPKSVSDICVTNYNLYVFETGSEDALELAEQMGHNHPELSLLLRMGCDDSIRNTIWREKNRDLIGQEAIREFLAVPDEEDPHEVNEERKKFLREQRDSKVCIELTKDISGDMQPIQEMIVLHKNSIYLDTSKRPDVGVYFDHIRYVDQYINWYKANHDREGTMRAETEKTMQQAVQSYVYDIVVGLKKVKADGNVSAMANRFEKALKARFGEDPTKNTSEVIHARFFYIQAIAAFIAKLPEELRKPEWNVQAAERFLSDALIVAPRISQRDIMMAGTFIYLARKEATLCQ